MPYIENLTSKKINEKNCKILNDEIVEVVCDITGKSKNSLMLSFSKADNMFFGESSDDIAYVYIKYLGDLTKEQKNELTLKIGEIYEKKVNILKSNIYINFTRFERGDWGYNGKTF